MLKQRKDSAQTKNSNDSFIKHKSATRSQNKRDSPIDIRSAGSPRNRRKGSDQSQLSEVAYRDKTIKSQKTRG